MSWWNVGAAAISVVGAVVSANSASNTAGVARQAADLQWDIANRIQMRDEEQHNIWRSYFRDGELSLHSRISQLRPVPIDYDRVAGRPEAEMRRQFSEARAQTLRTVVKYCSLPPSGMSNDMAIMQAGAEVWASAAMIRADEGLKRTLDAQHREERLQMAQMARQAYFKPGAGEMAANIARQLQTQASAAASQQAGAAAQLATAGFKFAEKAYDSYTKSSDITQRPQDWEYDSAMSSSQPAQTTQQVSPDPVTQSGITVTESNSGGDGGGDSGGGGGGIFDIFGL